MQIYTDRMKTIINQVYGFQENKKVTKKENNINAGEGVPAEESIHDRIVRERFIQLISVFCKYTNTLGIYMSDRKLNR
jgi:hypothetical protein